MSTRHGSTLLMPALSQPVTARHAGCYPQSTEEEAEARGPPKVPTSMWQLPGLRSTRAPPAVSCAAPRPPRAWLTAGPQPSCERGGDDPGHAWRSDPPVLQVEPQPSLRSPTPTALSTRPPGGPSFPGENSGGLPASPRAWRLHRAFPSTPEDRLIGSAGEENPRGCAASPAREPALGPHQHLPPESPFPAW